ncbi:iron complex outermembrane receptor protein [Oxalobacteraceae bacterium GrIS 1.11]
MLNEKKIVQLVRLAVAVIAGAATMAAQAQEAQPEKIQRVEITGSNIKRIDSEGISPITVMTRESIARSGATSVTELMSKLTSAGKNGGEMESAGSFRNGATKVELRGLPTLILLNGYRLPASGSDEYSGETSVDLNSIPLAAIERIDVLKDGASAIYGTDAVGGVINFILRKDYEGFAMDATQGQTTHGDGANSKVSLSGGFGDRDAQKFNVTYSASYEDSKRIRAVDRKWSNTEDFTNRPGGLHMGNGYGAKGSDPGTLSLGGAQRMPDPECAPNHVKPYPDAPEWRAGPNRNACMYSTAESVDLVRPYSRYGAASTANWDLTPNLSLFANLFYNHFDTKVKDAPMFIQNADRSGALDVAADNPYNTYGVPVVVRRLFPADEGGSSTSVNTTWLVGGATGHVGAWDWTASIGHSQEDGKTVVLGSYMFDKMQEYVANGKFNPFGGNHNSAQIISELSADQYTKTKSQTNFAKAVASTEFGQLPGGKIGLAVGAEYKKESLKYDPSQAWRDGAIGNYTTLLGIDGSESLGAVFGELNLPILKNLEAQAALRYDRYQLAGSTTNPKLGVRWTPMPTLMVRSSYSTGFRAPTLSQRFNEGRGGFLNAKDPKRCVKGDDYFDDDCSRSVLSLLTGTKELKPETSNQFNLGFLIEPVKDLTFGMTYWNIKWNDRIENLDNESVLAGEDGAYRNSVTRLAPTAEDQAAYNSLTPAQQASLGPLVGQLKQLRAGLINRSRVVTNGLDAEASYTVRSANFGKFKLSGEGSYTIKFNKSLLPDDPQINCPNNTACEAGQFELPRLLAKLSLNWDRGPWTATSTANFTSHFHVDRTPAENINFYYDEYNKGQMISSMTTVDVSASYAGFKDLVLRVGANNLFDRDPAFDPKSSLGYNTNYGNPRGRYVYVSAAYTFK